MKKVLAIALAVVMALSLAACGGAAATEAPAANSEAKTETKAEAKTEAKAEAKTEEAATATYKFALVEAGVHNYYAPFEGAAADAAKDLGIDTPVVQAPAEFVQEDQNKIIDALVAQGITGLATQPSDAVAANEKYEELVSMGIPVIGFGGAPETPSPMTFCLATDVGKSAYEGTLSLIEAMGGKGNIVHLTGGLEDVNTIARMDAVEQACKEKGCTLLQTITDVDDTELAQNALANLLSSQGDDVDGIIATGYNSSVAIATTFRQNNETRIKSIGCDTDDAVLQAIKDGFMTGTMSQNPYGQAYLCTYALKLLADGYKYVGDEFLVNSGFYLIDGSNVADTPALAAKATEDLKAEFEKLFTK